MIVSTSAFIGFLDNPNISDLRLAPAHRIDQRWESADGYLVPRRCFALL